MRILRSAHLFFRLLAHLRIGNVIHDNNGADACTSRSAVFQFDANIVRRVVWSEPNNNKRRWTGSSGFFQSYLTFNMQHYSSHFTGEVQAEYWLIDILEFAA